MDGLSGPFRAENGAIKALSHGSWFTVALVDKRRFTPEGRIYIAGEIARRTEAFEMGGLVEDLSKIERSIADALESDKRRVGPGYTLPAWLEELRAVLAKFKGVKNAVD